MQMEELTVLAGSLTCSGFSCTVGKLTAVSQPCYYQLVSICTKNTRYKANVLEIQQAK